MHDKCLQDDTAHNSMNCSHTGQHFQTNKRIETNRWLTRKQPIALSSYEMHNMQLLTLIIIYKKYSNRK